MEVYGHPLSEQLIADLTFYPEFGHWTEYERSSRHRTELRRPFQKPINTSLGLLGVLPTELVFMVLECLNYQTLTRLLRVSLQWKLTVEALYAYATLTRHAKDELNHFADTSLLNHFTILDLYRVLSSQECTVCREFGGFLFVATCERICHTCLRQNPAYWMFSFSMAQECFSPTVEEFGRLPVLEFAAGWKVRQLLRTSFTPLVSVEQAKELVDKRYGIERCDRARKFVGRRLQRKYPSRGMLYSSLQIASLDWLSPVFWCSCLTAFPEREAYGFAATIRFPFVKAGQVNYGRSCKGCEHTNPWVNHCPDSFPKLWSRSKFIEHIQRCNGVKQLLAEKKSRSSSPLLQGDANLPADKPDRGI
ncbi:hypothetical protein F5Y08DRAFT_347767 [Xylaria arbuscula]|nr:hypothetical protein F5Y08DRAFT_347767 [Xylaria arbuscula]